MTLLILIALAWTGGGEVRWVRGAPADAGACAQAPSEIKSTDNDILGVVSGKIGRRSSSLSITLTLDEWAQVATVADLYKQKNLSGAIRVLLTKHRNQS